MMRALVTGGSGDIGAAICRRLAEDGMHVIVHANTGHERARAVVSGILAENGSAETLCLDLTDTESTEAALEALVDHGEIQVLVNNAGIVEDAPLAGMSPAQWNKVIDVSLNGFYNTTRPLLLPMIRKRWGRIINITSVSGLIGNRGQTNYAAAKAGLHGATKSLAIELASRGITVNAVAPGIIAGRHAQENFDDSAIRAMVPMQRAGTPEEVAALVSFLASPDAAYISGQIISINGGMV